VVGVNLGHGCQIAFYPSSQSAKDTFTPRVDGPSHPLRVTAVKAAGGASHVNLCLPRRSVCVMSAQSRVDFKHAILKQSDKNLAPFPPPPPWNLLGTRRCLTLCSTKPYADALLRQLRDGESDPAKRCALQARLDASLRYGSEYAVS
jgi:hypothetical protein